MVSWGLWTGPKYPNQNWVLWGQIFPYKVCSSMQIHNSVKLSFFRQPANMLKFLLFFIIIIFRRRRNLFIWLPQKIVYFWNLSFSDIFAILVESCCPYIMIQHCFWVHSALASHSWFGEEHLLKLSGSFLRQSSALLLWGAGTLDISSSLQPCLGLINFPRLEGLKTVTGSNNHLGSIDFF